MSKANPRAPQAIVIPLSNAAFRFWSILAIFHGTLCNAAFAAAGSAIIAQVP
jgi:hypothetical protein